MYSTKILLLFSSLILSGCISLAPEYQRPYPKVPNNFLGNSTLLTVNEDNYEPPRWQMFITDSKMKTLIQLALDKNSDLYLAALNVEEARVRFGLSESDLSPQVNSSLSGDYRRGFNNSTLDKKYSAGLDISYELDFWGRIKNLTEVDRAKFLSSAEMRRATQITTIKTVAEAYLDVIYNQQLFLIAQETKNSYLNSQSIVVQKVAAGKGTIADLEQAKGQIQSVEINIEKIKSEIARNENLVNFLTNDYEQKIDQALPDYQMNYPLITAPHNISSEILLKRPDIIAAEQNILAENANIGAARAAFFPSISFNAGATGSNDSLSGLFDSSNGIWNFIPKITLPIFTGGRNSRNLELANISKEKAITNYEKSIQIAFREVKDSITIKLSLEKQLIAQENYVNTLNNILAQKQASYRYGSLSYLNVLEAQRDLFTEKQNLLVLKIEQQKNEINLFSALGGGLIE